MLSLLRPAVSFKFQELKLNGKSRILHFKCPYDFPVRNEFVGQALEFSMLALAFADSCDNH
jgi:hypothetical protein